MKKNTRKGLRGYLAGERGLPQASIARFYPLQSWFNTPLTCAIGIIWICVRQCVTFMNRGRSCRSFGDPFSQAMRGERALFRRKRFLLSDLMGAGKNTLDF